jgi:hypothetical protein
MNLVAFEYVACQEKRHGVLVISEFAGAAAFMGQGSITFHPANPQEIANAIHKGLTMNGQDRQANYEKLKQFVECNTRYVDLSFGAEISTNKLSATVPGGDRLLLSNYRNARCRGSQCHEECIYIWYN